VDVSALVEFNLVYFSTPYTKYEDGIEEAHREAARLSGKLLNNGVRFFSPICHSHPIATYGGIHPLDSQLWLNFDEANMGVCDAILIGKMKGWQHSYGVNWEYKYFLERGLPVYFLNTQTMEITGGFRNQI
jgi:hypothetical protein